MLLQSCLTFCDPMDHSLPGSSVHGILLARILEWVATPSSSGSRRLRDQTCISYVSCIGRQVLYHYCQLGSTEWKILCYLNHWDLGVVLLPWYNLSDPDWCILKRTELRSLGGFPGGASGKEPTCKCKIHEMKVQSLGWKDPLEEGKSTHSSIFDWRIPWTEEPGRL